MSSSIFSKNINVSCLLSCPDLFLATTNLNINVENLEVVKHAKFLGVIISDDHKWDKNTEY